MTFEAKQPTVAAGTIGIDLWLESDAEPGVLDRALRDALESTPAWLQGIEDTSGSLWPVPVAATTNRRRVRLVVSTDSGEDPTSHVLDVVNAVAPWSLVCRHDGPFEAPGVVSDMH